MNEPKKDKPSSLVGFFGLILLAIGLCGFVTVGIRVIPSLLVAIGALILAIEMVNGRLKLFG